MSDEAMHREDHEANANGEEERSRHAGSTSRRGTQIGIGNQLFKTVEMVDLTGIEPVTS